ncbi:MAG: HAD family hydrolase, partial [Bryobacteraceae bacterium]
MTPTYRDEDLALIFDMDGVIIDSTAIHIEAWRLYLNSHGIEVPDLESRMLGRHNDEIVREFFPGGALTGDLVFSHGARKEQVYRNLIGAGVAAKLVPGIKEFLTHRCHLPMAIATNAEPANVDFILDGAGIRDCFNAIVSGHDVERPKPFPDIYLRAASLLQAPPGRCIVFE